MIPDIAPAAEHAESLLLGATSTNTTNTTSTNTTPRSTTNAAIEIIDLDAMDVIPTTTTANPTPSKRSTEVIIIDDDDEQDNTTTTITQDMIKSSTIRRSVTRPRRCQVCSASHKSCDRTVDSPNCSRCRLRGVPCLPEVLEFVTVFSPKIGSARASSSTSTSTSAATATTTTTTTSKKRSSRRSSSITSIPGSATSITGASANNNTTPTPAEEVNTITETATEEPQIMQQEEEAIEIDTEPDIPPLIDVKQGSSASPEDQIRAFLSMKPLPETPIDHDDENGKIFPFHDLFVPKSVNTSRRLSSSSGGPFMGSSFWGDGDALSLNAVATTSTTDAAITTSTSAEFKSPLPIDPSSRRSTRDRTSFASGTISMGNASSSASTTRRSKQPTTTSPTTTTTTTDKTPTFLPIRLPSTSSGKPFAQIINFFHSPVPALFHGPTDNGHDLSGILMEYSLRQLVNAPVPSLQDLIGWVDDDEVVNGYFEFLGGLEVLAGGEEGKRVKRKRKGEKEKEKDEKRAVRKSRRQADDDDNDEDNNEDDGDDLYELAGSDGDEDDNENGTKSTRRSVKRARKDGENDEEKVERKKREKLSDEEIARLKAEKKKRIRELYGVPYRPRPRETKPDEQTDETSSLPSPLRELYSKKQYLDAGLYSSSFKGLDLESTQSLKGIRYFKFPLPTNYGIRLLEQEVDFELPIDIHTWVETQGGVNGIRTTVIEKTDPTPFKRVQHNIFVDRKQRRAKEVSVCVCKPPEDGSEGCGDECLNRCSLVECDPRSCPCGDKCSNQRIQKKQELPGIEVYWTQSRGYGLRTSHAIPRGSFIIEYCGEVISQERCLERMSEAYKDHKNFYFLDYDNGEVIDGTVKGTIARFVNHSCDPNCHIEKWGVDGEFAIGIFASKDIPALTELTYDYNFKSFGHAQACFCGSEKCSGLIGGGKSDGAGDRKKKSGDRKGSSSRHDKTKTERLNWTQKQKLDALRDTLKDLLKNRYDYLRRKIFATRNYLEVSESLLQDLLRRDSQPPGNGSNTKNRASTNFNFNSSTRSNRARANLVVKLGPLEFDLIEIYSRPVLTSEEKCRRRRGLDEICEGLMREKIGEGGEVEEDLYDEVEKALAGRLEDGEQGYDDETVSSVSDGDPPVFEDEEDEDGMELDDDSSIGRSTRSQSESVTIPTRPLVVSEKLSMNVPMMPKALLGRGKRISRGKENAKEMELD